VVFETEGNILPSSGVSGISVVTDELRPVSFLSSDINVEPLAPKQSLDSATFSMSTSVIIGVKLMMDRVLAVLVDRERLQMV
jgi:hypothetical protein